MNSTEFVVDALATYRLTKLVIDDEITGDLRDAAYKHLDEHPGKLSSKLTYFLSCPWCVSVWAGGLLKAVRLVSPKTANIISGTLAASAVTGIIYTKLQ